MQVVLVGNSLPALNDVTANELPEIVAKAAKVLISMLYTFMYFFNSSTDTSPSF